MVDTMLQLRDEFRERNVRQGSGDASKGGKGVSRLRTRSSAMPCPYPPLRRV